MVKFLISILFIITLFSCTKKEVGITKVDIKPEFSLRILNDTINKNDTIEIEFSASFPSFFYVRSNQLNDFYNSNKTSIYDNKLTLLYYTENGQIINNNYSSLVDENMEMMFSYNENCDDNKIEFVIDKESLSKRIKIPIITEMKIDEFETLGNSKIYISIQYISVLNLVMKCYSEEFKNKIEQEKLNIFTGKLESNSVYFNY